MNESVHKKIQSFIRRPGFQVHGILEGESDSVFLPRTFFGQSPLPHWGHTAANKHTGARHEFKGRLPCRRAHCACARGILLM